MPAIRDEKRDDDWAKKARGRVEMVSLLFSVLDIYFSFHLTLHRLFDSSFRPSMSANDAGLLDENVAATSLLWHELNKPPIFLKMRSSTGFIGVTAFVAAFTVGYCQHEHGADLC